MDDQDTQTNFYDDTFGESGRRFMEPARRMDGLDEEIAVLRVCLRMALKHHGDDHQAVERLMRALTQALLARYRTSSVSSHELADNVAATLRSIGEQLMPLD